MSNVVRWTPPPGLPPKRLDVSSLPSGATDHRAAVWWGNLLLLCIESTMFALLIAAYFYLRQNYHAFPPPRALRLPTSLHPDPYLPVPILNLLVIIGSAIPMYFADVAAKRMDRAGIIKWSGIAVLLGALAVVLRFAEFGSLIFKWDENAYASTAWTILGVHLAHLITVTIEGAVTWAWVWLKGLDPKHALDVRCSAVYWYWVSGMWVILFAVVFLAPRIV